MTPSQQPLLNLSLPDGQRFESFFISPGNELILKDIKSSITNPEHQQLFIWGGENSGKSHLLQACCYQAFTQGIAAAYIPLSTLKHHGVDIFDGSSTYQLIAIDGINTVLGDGLLNNDVLNSDRWELALFNLINKARENQQTLLFSADENPRHLNCKLADLQSRLLWGTSHQINELSDDEKTAALKFRAAIRGIELDSVVIEYIYKRYPRDFTTLMDILDKLDKESLSSQRKITIPLVKQALNSFIKE